MLNDPAIIIHGVKKDFTIVRENINSIRTLFSHPLKFFTNKKSKLHVFKDLNLEIGKGEFVGIIGKNGSGKSTLLKLIAGIFAPNKGQISIFGQLIPFLELGVGFNYDLTVKENVFLNGTILGMTKKELKQKYVSIIEFAELQQFVDTPIKNLSSGMQLRLALSIALQVKADIYLLDEIFAVGDMAFRDKSLQRLQEILKTGATVLFVSHSMEQISQFCSRAIFIDSGEIKADGEPNEVIEKYVLSTIKHTESESVVQEKKDKGDGRAEITSFKIYDIKKKEATKFLPLEECILELEAKIVGDVGNPIVAIDIRSDDSALLVVNTSRQEKRIIPPLKNGDTIKVKFKGKIPLNPGSYTLRAFIGDPIAYGRGSGSFASYILDIAKITVVSPVDNYVLPEWTAQIAHDFTYDYKVT